VLKFKWLAKRMSCMEVDCSHLNDDVKRLNYPYYLYLYICVASVNCDVNSKRRC